MCSTAKKSAAHEAWALLLDVWLEHKHHFAECAARHGLSIMQAHLLNGLEPDEPLRMNVIATELEVDASHVTGIVDRLERSGLVERKALDGDRRVKLVVLTPQGAVVRRALLEELLSPPDALLELGGRDQRALRDLLRQLLSTPI